MKRKFLIIGGLLLLAGAALANVSISTYRVDGFDSNNLEVGAYFDVTVSYTNNTNSEQTIVGALFYFDYSTTYLDEIEDADITTDGLASYLTSKTNSDFTPVAGQFRYQRDAGAGTGRTVSVGENIECFTVRFHVKQDDNLAQTVELFNWLYPQADNVILTVAGGVNVTGDISDFQDATLRIGYNPIFSGVSSINDPETGNTLTINWTAGASKSQYNHDNDTGTPNNASGAETNYSNGLLKHRVYRDQSLVHTSATAGNTTWTNTSLNDMQEYAFNVEAIDDCSETPNESASGVTLNGTPHDYAAPGASISITGQEDQQLNLFWGTGDSDDLGGYIVIRKEAELEETVNDPPTIAGASGDSNGTAPDDAKTTLENDGWTVVAEGTSTSLTDTGLDNSKRYHYWVYAYDKTANEGATNPVHQGYNYSMAGTNGVPGAAPGAVSELRALSDITNGLTLNWRTSDPPNYAGTRFVPTTNYDDWALLDVNSAEAFDHDFTGEDAPVTEVLSREGLDPNSIYYFTAFAYNSSKLLWSDAVYTAAVPGGADVTEVATAAVTVIATQAVEVTLQKKSEGYGLNDLIVPFSPLYVNNTQIENLQGLVNVINTMAGEVVVTAAGVWDEDNMKIIVGTYDGDGNINHISEGYSSLEEVSLSVGDALQVSVTQNVDVTLKNYSEE